MCAGVIKAPVPEVLRFNAHVPSLSSPGLVSVGTAGGTQPTASTAIHLAAARRAKQPESRPHLRRVRHAQQDSCRRV